MAAPLNLGQVADLVDLSIQKIVKKEADRPMQLKKYYNYRTTTDLYEKDSSMSGLKEAEFTEENAEILEDVPVQGQENIEALLKFQLINGEGLNEAVCLAR
jgi:hypothetical protein